MGTIVKRYISAQELLELSYELGERVFASGFRPTWMISLFRGGTPVGIAVQELLQWMGVKVDHIAIRTQRYPGIDVDMEDTLVHGTEYFVKTVTSDDIVLIVEDVLDKGKTMRDVLKKLKAKTRGNFPKQVRVATVFNKPSRSTTGLVPDYFVEETNEWLVFPHELEGMTIEEVKKTKGPRVGACLERLLAPTK